jgi:hypothetical protein
MDDTDSSDASSVGVYEAEAVVDQVYMSEGSCESA